MNKGKQWKWSKKIRKELESQEVKPLEINLMPKNLFSPKEKKLMKKAEVEFLKVMELIGRPDPLMESPEYYTAFHNKRKKIKPRPKKLRGICLNWPGEEVK